MKRRLIYIPIVLVIAYGAFTVYASIKTAPRSVFVDGTSMFKADSAHTSRYDDSRQPEGFQKWKFSYKGEHISTPVTAGDAVFIATGRRAEGGWEDERLWALDAATGESVWNLEMPGAAACTAPAVHDDTLFVNTGDALHAVDASSGRSEKWTFPVREDSSRGPCTPPTIEGDIIYFSTPQSVLAISVDGGKEIWRAGLAAIGSAGPESGTSPVAAADGAVYFGDIDGTLFALDSRSGEVLWRFDSGSPILASPVASRGAVFFGNGSDNIYALDAGNGTLKWRFHTNGWMGGLAAAGDSVYFGTSFNSILRDPQRLDETGEYLYALDAGTGEVRWKHAVKGGANSLASAGSAVFFHAELGALHALDDLSGDLLWEYQTQGPVEEDGTYYSPAIHGDSIYFVSYQTLVALR